MMGRDAPALTRPDVAAWLWPRMQAAFPTSIASLLMPDHPHLLPQAEEPQLAQQKLARLLGQLARRFEIRHAADVANPDVIRPGIVLARQVRYIALNPCRDGLVRCPLAWTWSTHRDVVGATVDPWVTAERLAAALGAPARDFAKRHHAYVSADPSTAVAGTALPVGVESTRAPMVGLGEIAAASASALRVPLATLRGHGDGRALFAALAHDQGWHDTGLIAKLCDCVPSTIRRMRQHVDTRALAAARLCLADLRLRSATTSAEVEAWVASAGLHAMRAFSGSESTRSPKMRGSGAFSARGTR
ncbi:MAG TPA: hypothetical protein VG755_30465 [Nannocystaceae bacterium]|nr:hypothetical protein [Nannocystaceae bacterium]